MLQIANSSSFFAQTFNVRNRIFLYLYFAGKIFFQFPCVLQKNIFLLYIVRKVITVTIKIKILLNVSQLNSIPQFLRTSFQEVNYNNRAFITIKEKKKRSGFFHHVSCRILSQKYKHIQRKVDQWLVFAVIRQKISSFRLNIINGKLT